MWSRPAPVPANEHQAEITALTTELCAVVGEAEGLKSLLRAANTRVRIADERVAEYVDRLDALQSANEAKDREISELRAAICDCEVA